MSENTNYRKRPFIAWAFLKINFDDTMIILIYYNNLVNMYSPYRHGST